MRCPKCQTENLSGSAFCEECSAPLEAGCATCGAGNRPTAKFCPRCRAPLTAAPEPRAYTPNHLADKILTSRSARIGDDLRMDYTAQGHTVGLAARMQELASPDTAYLTGHTAELVSGYLNLDDLGPFPVKGVGDPVPVFQLQGIGAVRTRFDASRARGLTRFVGRGDDMQTLQSALARVREGNGQVVGIVANAGVGKSRLTSLTPLVLLDHAELAGLEDDSGARQRALLEAKTLFAALGAPLRVRQIETLLAG